MTKAILFNAPKMAGKDVAINHLRGVGIPLVVREAKDKLHLLTREFFCLSEKRYWEIYNDRSLKEEALEDFQVYLTVEEGKALEKVLGCNFGNIYSDKNSASRMSKSPYWNLSIREAMIYVSEIICKPRFGKNYFGESRAKSVKGGEIITDGSTGFQEELPPLIERLGQENIILLRVHRDGCTFEGDSRNWIPDGVITNTVDVYNNGSEESYLRQVENIVRGFLNG